MLKLRPNQNDDWPALDRDEHISPTQANQKAVALKFTHLLKK